MIKKQFFACKVALWVLLFSLYSLTGFAGVETSTSYIRLHTLSATNTYFTVQDNKYGMAVYNTALVQSLTGKISLQVFDTTHPVSAYNYTLWMKITSYDMTGVQIGSPIVRSVSVSYDPGIGVVTSDMSSLILSGAARVDVQLLSATAPHTANLTTIPTYGNLALSIEIETTRYYPFPTSYSWTSGSFGYNLIADGSGGMKFMEAYWDFIPGAEEYDLEWTFVDNYYVSGSSNSNLAVHFQNNATRVTVTDNSYKIPLVFEQGYVVFRVRGVGRDLSNVAQYIEGNWSVSPSGNLGTYSGYYTPATHSAGLYTNSCVYYTSPHVNDGLNWQYNATFAEDGKRKHTVNYADGSLRGKQIITENNSDQTVIVGEFVYDYQGRKAIDILPVPDPAGSNQFSYRNNFNLDASSNDYNKKDFDIDPSGSFCSIVPQSLPNTSGASKYYSENNTNTNGFQAYTPNAFGYPFMQTVYTPDNTGRISSQSGVGDNHYTGTDHETKYYYGSPDQSEIDALFGTDVGNFTHYQKNLIVDANGQTSVSYLNMEGKTIATALSGGSSSNMSSVTEPGTPTSTITATYINTNSATGTSVIDGNTVSNNGLTFTKMIVIDAPTTYTVNYDVKPETYALTCADGTTTYCFDCIYDLQVSLVDQCGTEYIPTNISPKFTYVGKTGYVDMVGHTNTSGGTFTSFDFDVSGCHNTSTYTAPPFIISVNLNPGSYMLNKTLSVNNDALNYYLQQYLLSPCVQSAASFTNTANDNMDTTGCYIPCTDCQQTTNLCEANYQAMLSDVSPGGQYAEFDNNSGTIDASAYPVSILNTLNSLPRLSAVSTANYNHYIPSWQNPIFNGAFSPYRYSNGMIAYVPVDITDANYIPGTGVGQNPDVIQITLDPTTNVYIPCTSCTSSYLYGVMPHQLKTLTDFKNNWNNSFARSLVEYHPEFAYYQFCITTAGQSEHYYPADYATLASISNAGTYNSSTGVYPSMLSFSSGTFQNDWLPNYTLNTWAQGQHLTCSGGSATPSATYISSDQYDNFLHTTITTTCEALAFTGYSDCYTLGTTTHDLIDMDPMFYNLTSGSTNPYIKNDVFGGGTSVQKMQKFRQILYDKLNNISGVPGNPSQTISIKQALVISTPTPASNCSNVFYAPKSPSTCNSTFSSPPTSGVLTDDQLRHYISFYLSAKQDVVKMMEDEFAMVGDFAGAYNYGGTTNDYFYQLNGTNSSAYVPGAGHPYRQIKGYNGCIGNSSFNAASVGFLRMNGSGFFPGTFYPSIEINTSGTQINSYPNFYQQLVGISQYLGGTNTSTPGFGILDLGQTCHTTDVGKYSNKVQRFQSGNAVASGITGGNTSSAGAFINNGAAQADYFYYEKTGVCPILTDYVNLLNFLAGGAGGSSSNNLTTTYPLWNYPQFTKRLYDGMVDNSCSNCFAFVTYVPQISGSTMSIDLKYYDDPASYPGTATDIYPTRSSCNNFLTLTLPSGLSSFSAITEVDGAYNFVTSLGVTSFVLAVKAGAQTYYMNATSCLPFNNCISPPNGANLACSPTPLAIDLLNLMNGVLAGGSFSSTSAVDVSTSSSNYNLLFNTTNILYQLNTTVGACNWTWTASGGSYVIASTNPTSCPSSITINLSGSLPTSAGSIYFSGIQKDVSGNDIVVVDYYTSSGSVLTEQTTTLTISIVYNDGTGNTTLPANICQLPQDPSCSNPAVSNLNDFTVFAEGLQFGEVPRTLPPTISNLSLPYNLLNGMPGFTANLASQLSGPAGSIYYATAPVYNGNSAAFAIVYQNSSTYDTSCMVTIHDAYDTDGNPFNAGNITSFTVTGIDYSSMNSNGNFNTVNCFATLCYGDIVCGVNFKITSSCFDINTCTSCIPPPPQIIIPGATPTSACSSAWSTFTSSANFAGSVYDASIATPTTFSLTEQTFCDLGLDACVTDYINMYASLATVASTINSYITPDIVPLNPWLDPSSNYFVSLQDFCSHSNSKVCGSSYTNYLNTFSAPPCLSAGTCPDYHLLNLNEFTSQLCTVTSCPSNIQPSPPYSTQYNEDSACVSQKMNIAISNGMVQYQQYINQITLNFKNAYISKCLTALEDLNSTYINKKFHYTLYYYDQAGNLIKTVPPAGVKLITATSSPKTLADVVTARNSNTVVQPGHAMSSVYQYNSLNQLIAQFLPDHDYYKSDFYYDALGRMVLSQNPKQKHNKHSSTTWQYSYTNYDALGRITEVGEVNAASTNLPQGNSTIFNSITNPIAFNAWINPLTRQEVTKTTYDYATYPLSDFQTDFLRQRVTSTSIDQDGDGTPENTTHYSYDVHGNVQSLIHTNNYNPTESIGDIRVDYTYDLISGKVNTVDYQNGNDDQFHHKYWYDADNRLIEASTSKDGYFWAEDAKYFYYLHGPLARVEIGKRKVQAMDYYYTMQGWIRGVNSEALSNKNDPGKDAYTETGGGDPNAYSTTQHNLHALVGLDNFAYSLGYYEQSSKTINTVSTTLHKDYSPIKNGSSYGYQPLTDPMGDPSTLLASGTYSPYLTSLYNGNIKHMGTTIVNAAPNYMVQALLQGFTYDQLNRITNSASFYAYTGTTNTTGGMIDNTSGNSNFNIWPILSGAINTSATSYTYEANGNIQHLTRNQYNNSSTTFSLIDDIAYTYSNNPSLVNPNSGSGYTNTNKLKVAADAASVSSGLDLVSGQLLSPANYDYDDIGNLVQDNQEGLSNIVWNVYGKIESVTHNTSSGKHDLEFRYDSKGNRIMKIDKPRSSTTPYGPLNQSNWVYTIYERDAQGNVLATYELKYIAQGGSLYSKSLTLLEHDIYGGKRIGLYNRSTENISNNSLLFTGDLTTGVFTNINTNPPDPIFSQKNIYSFGLTNNYGQKRYELVNHLDNVMNVVSDNKIGQVSGTTIAYYKADPYRATDYYAFGQPMADRNFANDEGTYRYGFNGKEQDDEVHGQAGGSYDFDARMYDPRLGRWLSIDPCFKRYSANSPYTYALNSPIILFDNDGRLVTFANAASEKAFNEHYAAADAATQAKLDKLKSSDVIYHVDVTANLPNGYNGNTQYDFAKGAKGVDFVSVNISSTISAAQKVSALGDELETASQFENGDIGFAQKPDGSTATLGYDLADEAATKKASIDAVHNYNKKYGTNYGLDKAEQNFEKALNDPIPTGKTRSDVIDDYFNNDPTGKLYKQTVDPRATSVKVHIGGDGGLNDAQIQNAVLGGVIKAAVLRYFNPSSKKQETSYTGPK